MDIKSEQFKTSKTARFSTFGAESSKAKYFWFALHGSQMTCEQMLYKFADFNLEEHCIVAPEALNRFYLDGFGGEVVASWMTKRDRLSEIEDFSNYLSSLYQKFTEQLPESAIKIILGFSQGGTTMYRWLHARKVETDFLIPYSCWIPEDIDLEKSKTELNKITTKYTYGLQDQFLNKDVISKVEAIVKKNKLEMEILPYEGDHRVSKQQLKVLLDELN